VVLTVLAGIALAAGLAWNLRPEVAYASEPPAEVVMLRSQVASLEAALYIADAERCASRHCRR
jgi:hypothetical protein